MKGKALYSTLPVLPTLIGTFVGWWLGDKIKPATDTASGGGGVGGLVGGILGFVVGQRIPTARLANPKRKNPGAKWHEERAEFLAQRSLHTKPSREKYDAGAASLENKYAADASRRLGMNPKRKHRR